MMRTSPVDWIVAVLAIAGLALFLSIIAWSVPEPVLLIVLAAGFLLAVYDLLIMPVILARRQGRRS